MAKKATTKKTVNRSATNKSTANKTALKKKPAAERKMSQLDAAAKVLASSKEPLNCKAMVEKMEAKGYWSSPAGKTPAATLYASLLRHIRQHGKDARFQKTGPGHFSLKTG